MSATLRCGGTPISWLRLEQHHAGELPRGERDSIAAHLATCGACAACFARIEADAASALLVLPTATPAVAPPGKLLVLRRLAPVLAGLALAAALLLIIGRRPPIDPRGREDDPLSPRTKGGSVGFVLVRDDDGLVAEAGGIYRDGDRWKALVTCPAAMHAAWDLVVFEHGSAAFPLEPRPDLTCGNGVPLRGAFRTTGHEPMTVCLVWDDGALVDRGPLRRDGASPETLPHAVCKVLDPAN